MPSSNERGLSPRDFARTLFRYWKRIAFVFCGITLLGLFAIALYPRSYGSEAKLMIRIGRESVALDPTATTGDTIMLQKTQDDEVNSAVGILNSRKVLERIVEQVGADRILGDTPADKNAPAAESSSANPLSWLRGTMVALHLSDPGTTTDQAVRSLERSTEVSAPKQSAVITLKYSAPDPLLAHDVVDAMTNIFLEEHSRLNQNDGSLQFFAEQSQKLFNDLTAAQQKLRDRKNEYQQTSAIGPRSMMEQAKDAMRQKVFELESQENDLASRYTDEYPPLKEVRRQRALAEKMLTGATASEVSMTAAVSIDPQHPKVSPASLQVTKASNEAQGGLRELQKLNEQEFELAQLEREVKLLEGKYAMHVQKMEEARVNDALGREKITNVKIAQPATLVYKPTQPNKMLLLLGTLALAVAASFGSAVAADRLDPTLRSTDQVERELGLPVLASMPYRRGGKKSKASSLTRAMASSNGAASVGPASHAKYRRIINSLGGASKAGASATMVGIVGCGGSKKLRSRIAAGMAMEAASSGAGPVLLIDGDQRGRQISKRFDLNGAPGWTNVLAGVADAKSCVQASKTSNLSVMGPGKATAESSPNGQGMCAGSDLDAIKSDYRMVLVDLPPGGELDAAKIIDRAVLVVDAERTRVQSAQRAKEMLERAGVRVAGVVLANRRDHIPQWLYKRL